MDLLPSHIFCDGGVIGRNPSLLGGTFCWIWTDSNNQPMKSGWGVISPEDLGVPKITNNMTELLAAVRALTSVPLDWAGFLYTDSKITRIRLTNGQKFKNIPQCLRQKVLDLRRHRRWKVVQVAGHPTREELISGYRKGTTLPVSIHNVACDLKCQELAQEFSAKGGPVSSH